MSRELHIAIKRVEVMVRLATPADWNAAKVDLGGIKDSGNDRYGGLVELRLPFRLVIQVTAWWQLVGDMCQAINAAIWRREDRRRGDT